MVVTGEVSSGAGVGAQSDLALATRLALQMEREWCLTDDGLAWFDVESTPLLLTDPRLRNRVEARLHAAESEAIDLISRHIEYLHRLAEELLQERELDGADIFRILRGIGEDSESQNRANVVPFTNFIHGG